MPATVRTMPPTLAAAMLAGAGWVHEVKHDGWRIVARIEDGAVRLTTRSGRLDQPVAVAGVVVCGKEDRLAVVAALDDVQRLIRESGRK
jgi:hypothetical protein